MGCLCGAYSPIRQNTALFIFKLCTCHGLCSIWHVLLGNYTVLLSNSMSFTKRNRTGLVLHLSMLLKSTLYSDVTLVAFDKLYFLHKPILTQSPFFSNLFSKVWECSQQGKFNDYHRLSFDDPNVTQHSFNAIIKYLYTCELEVASNESIFKFLCQCIATCEYLQLSCLSNQFTRHLLAILKSTMNQHPSVSECNELYDVAIFFDNSYYGAQSRAISSGITKILSAMPLSEIPLDLVMSLPDSSYKSCREALFDKHEPLSYRLAKYLILCDKDTQEEIIGHSVTKHALNSKSADYFCFTFEELRLLSSLKDADGRVLINPRLLHKGLWDRTVHTRQLTD